MPTNRIKLNTQRGRATRTGGRATRPPNRPNNGGSGYAYTPDAPRTPFMVALGILGWIGTAAALCGLVYITLELNTRKREQREILGQNRRESLKEDADGRENLRSRRDLLESLRRQELLKSTEKKSQLSDLQKEVRTVSSRLKRREDAFKQQIREVRQVAGMAMDSRNIDADADVEATTLTLADLRTHLTDKEAERERLEEEWREAQANSGDAAAIDPSIVRIRLNEGALQVRPVPDTDQTLAYIIGQIQVTNTSEDKDAIGLRILVYFYGKSERMDNQYVIFHRESTVMDVRRKQTVKYNPIEVPVGIDRKNLSYLGAQYEGYIILVSDGTRKVIQKIYKTDTFKEADLNNLLPLRAGDRFTNTFEKL